MRVFYKRRRSWRTIIIGFNWIGYCLLLKSLRWNLILLYYFIYFMHSTERSSWARWLVCWRLSIKSLIDVEKLYIIVVIGTINVVLTETVIYIIDITFRASDWRAEGISLLLFIVKHLLKYISVCAIFFKRGLLSIIVRRYFIKVLHSNSCI